MGTTKVVIRRTAKKKEGNTQGTIKNSTKVAVNGNTQKMTTTKTRTVTRKSGGISVNYVKGS